MTLGESDVQLMHAAESYQVESQAKVKQPFKIKLPKKRDSSTSSNEYQIVKP